VLCELYRNDVLTVDFKLAKIWKETAVAYFKLYLKVLDPACCREQDEKVNFVHILGTMYQLLLHVDF
jgi:hypothetical protein